MTQSYMGKLQRSVCALMTLLTVSSIGCVQVVERTYRGPNDISITNLRGPLPADAFKAHLELSYPPPRYLKPGELAALHVIVTNVSNEMWPCAGLIDGQYRIDIGNHWLDRSGKTIVPDDGRGELPYDLRPGQKAEVLVRIRAPETPGDYLLELDAVQEGVAWFAEKGSDKLRLNVTVEN